MRICVGEDEPKKMGTPTILRRHINLEEWITKEEKRGGRLSNFLLAHTVNRNPEPQLKTVYYECGIYFSFLQDARYNACRRLQIYIVKGICFS
jgi:hypothetical protein